MMFSDEDELDRARLRIKRLEKIRKAWSADRRFRNAMLNAPTEVHGGESFFMSSTTTDYSKAFEAYKSKAFEAYKKMRGQ